MIPGVSFPSLTAEHISAWLPPLSAWSAAQDHPFGYICIHDTPHLLWSPGWPPDSRAPQSHKSGKPSYSLEGLSGCMHQPREFVCPPPPPPDLDFCFCLHHVGTNKELSWDEKSSACCFPPRTCPAWTVWANYWALPFCYAIPCLPVLFASLLGRCHANWLLIYVQGMISLLCLALPGDLKKKGILSAFFLNKDFCKMELCNVYVGRKEKLVAPPLTTVIAPFLNGILLFSSLHWQLLQVTLYVRCIQTLAPAVHIQKIECTRHEIHFYSFFTVLGICKYSVSCIISFSSDGKELPQGECMSLICGKGSLGDLQGKVKILLLSIMATVKLFNKKESVIIIPINLCCWWCSLLSFWKGRCKNMHLGEKSSL